MCLHPRQLLSVLLCNFLRWGWVCDLLLAVVADEMNRSYSAAGCLGGVNTSTPLHLLVCLHCGLLSLSCLLTGSGGWGLVPATYCDMLTKRAGTSRFREIHRKKEHVGRKRLLHWKEAEAAISSSLLLEKGQQVSSTLSDGRPPPPSGVGQIAGAGLTEPWPLLFNNRITKSLLKLVFECHVI